MIMNRMAFQCMEELESIVSKKGFYLCSDTHYEICSVIKRYMDEKIRLRRELNGRIETDRNQKGKETRSP